MSPANGRHVQFQDLLVNLPSPWTSGGEDSRARLPSRLADFASQRVAGINLRSLFPFCAQGRPEGGQLGHRTPGPLSLREAPEVPAAVRVLSTYLRVPTSRVCHETGQVPRSPLAEVGHGEACPQHVARGTPGGRGRPRGSTPVGRLQRSCRRASKVTLLLAISAGPASGRPCSQY